MCVFARSNCKVAWQNYLDGKARAGGESANSTPGKARIRLTSQVIKDGNIEAT